MIYTGVCHKMKASIGETTTAGNGSLAASVEYQLVLDGIKPNPLTDYIGKSITLRWEGDIYCIGCGSATPKSYSQGYCYKCLISKAECDMCLMKPETCHYDAGTCRDESFAHNLCFKPHIVYLANSSGLKVGITRATQIPTRWLDQGATEALPIMQVQTRKVSGLVEVLFAQTIADKTNWRAMLKGESQSIDLVAVRDSLFSTYAAELAQIAQDNQTTLTPLLAEQVRSFAYPVSQYPTKISSHNLEKTAEISGVLHGIKGQYLLLDTGVINLRKYTGFSLTVSV